MQELSVKSSTAVKETTELIKICLDTSMSGTKTVRKTADFLSHMVCEVKKTHDPIAAITYSSNEQASTLSDMVADISQISNITHETSAFAMESADIAKILVAQSQELKAQLSQFMLESSNV